jgi:Tfp pilus assembly protein PilO
MKNWPWYGHLVLAFLIFAALYFFYFKPQDATIKRIQRQRLTVENQLVNLRIKKAQLDELKAQLATMAAELEKLELVIPRTQEISNILSRVQQLAYDTRLVVQRFIPQALEDKEFYAEKPINIETTGSYHNLASFFDRLSKFSRLFTVSEFTITALRRQTDASTITANSTAKTYVFRTPPAPKKKKPAARGN